MCVPVKQKIANGDMVRIDYDTIQSTFSVSKYQIYCDIISSVTNGTESFGTNLTFLIDRYIEIGHNSRTLTNRYYLP